MIRIEKEIELTGEELAKEFWEKDCEQQAEFFNKNYFNNNGSLEITQMNWMTEYLDKNGRKFIKELYDRVKELEDEEKTQNNCKN